MSGHARCGMECMMHTCILRITHEIGLRFSFSSMTAKLKPMPDHSIALDGDTHAKVTLLARAWDVTPAQVVGRLVDHFHNPAPSPAVQAANADGTVAVHAFYEGCRVSGRYDPANRSLTVDPGPGAGRYKSPSGAATAVLQALKPEVHPNRNGWSFWLIDDSGRALQTIRGAS